MPASALAVDKAVVVTPDQVPWKDTPIIPGGKGAVLFGDPTKSELVVMRSKFPANFKHMPHTHPFTEVVTVIGGNISFGLGDKFDTLKGEKRSPGTFFVVPANTSHFVWTGDQEGIVQFQFIGPLAIDYINPADDPRKK
jgi:quercetin dioxygenase-like cupin family protein